MSGESGRGDAADRTTSGRRCWRLLMLDSRLIVSGVKKLVFGVTILLLQEMFGAIRI